MGLAKFVIGKTYTTCGTFPYLAPEVLRRRGYTLAMECPSCGQWRPRRSWSAAQWRFLRPHANRLRRLAAQLLQGVRWRPRIVFS